MSNSSLEYTGFAVLSTREEGFEERSRFSEWQIRCALRQAESGTPLADICRQLGVTEAIHYLPNQQYASLGVSERRRLRQVEDENRRLKELVADLTLGKPMLSEAS